MSTVWGRLADALRPNPVTPVEAKAESGIGAFWMANEPSVSSLSRSPQKLMAEAQSLSISDLYIRAAERVISQRFATVPWHLEDSTGEELGAEHPTMALLEKPYHPLPTDPRGKFPRTRSQLWGITSRHMGVCGIGFWYLDGSPALQGLPIQTLYINPARMWPAEKSGNLSGWVLDYDGRGGGVPLDLDKVLVFWLETPDTGWFPPGLVESAMAAISVSAMGLRHAADTLSSGGRRPGLYSAKGDQPIPDEIFKAMQRELRSIKGSPDATKRDLVLQGPVEFKETSATPEQLQLVDVLANARDDKLALWGVPYSQLGGTTPAGLNSGGKGGFEEAALWQNAVGPRLNQFREVIQFDLLDRSGEGVQLIIEEPSFDDDAPMYEMAANTVNLPLSNDQRLALIGMDPLDPAVYGDLGKAIYITSSLVDISKPPPALVPFTGPNTTEPDPMDAMQMPAKASPLRRHADVTWTPKMQRAVQSVLDEQRAEVASKVEQHASHLTSRPRDTDAWWNAKKWDEALTDALSPFVAAIAEHTERDVRKRLHRPGKASSNVIARLTKAIAKRVTSINEYTRDAISALIQSNIGLGGAELGRLVAEAAPFTSDRAERIARTETGTYLNLSQVATFGEYGVDRVEVIDGDGDDVCASADGQTWTLEEAEADPLGHPNCVRDFAPVVDEPKASTDFDPERIARALAALKGVQDAMTTYVTVNVPEQKAQTPEVHVHVPQQAAPVVNVTNEQPAPVVNVTTPDVTVTNVVPEAKAGTVQDIRIVEMPRQPVHATIKRDSQGRIVGVEE